MFVIIWIEEIGVVDELVGGNESRVESPGEVAGLARAARCTKKITEGLRGIVRRSVRRVGAQSFDCLSCNVNFAQCKITS